MLRETLRAILHSIIFHRMFGALVPKEQDILSLNLTFVKVSPY